MQTFQDIINHKTKPLGSLGKLEQLALQLATIQSSEKIAITLPQMLVFAGDHGIAAHNISIAPSAVTTLMVNNFLNGGAAINCFARTLGWQLKVIDCGILTDITHPSLIKSRLGQCTGDISKEPAMDKQQLDQAFSFCDDFIAQLARQGTNLLGFGEMGIGNTSPAAALCAALLKLPASQTVGAGTGINSSQLEAKLKLIECALARLTNLADLTPEQLLLELGGFEISHLVAAILAGFKHNMILLIDGFIVTAAALIAIKINPKCQENMIFAHCSMEQAHQKMLRSINAEPLLDLGLRLGEGTGAALALPLVLAAASFFNDMASFTDVGIEL
ncbi:nicotinate-nucleotide--dimethylbenzimidazole phosphoribosyltransferase [Pseudoalteromonas tunicata]|uniref:nicotinate-nucleotide--dimethylbenzimidazole phosphoribosyltransferase n=1 Tax=Pseudoalteromonas tunicata TaxID=314281 RepID=UPI00273FF12E|nr:nicotinate-nucleotide--dimethylbenzimidazole phosphoribosyltransferase [Pseudoalteromonas tunicata]MDP5211990.1 nicotinate-nucleotide--dimethylbenzimidazole phosphoribosyltransferase [Pseudoalteromonas tunicata]